jgi:hypothetical protein
MVQPLAAPAVPTASADKKMAGASLAAALPASLSPAAQNSDDGSRQGSAMTAATSSSRRAPGLSSGRPAAGPRAPSRSARRVVARSASTAPQPEDGWVERLAVTAAANAPVSQARNSCDRLERRDLAWCMRPQLLDADRQLRDAYHQASQTGVDRRVLSSYRRQWSKFRRQANSDPRRVTAGFREMAQRLDAERTGAGGN